MELISKVDHRACERAFKLHSVCLLNRTEYIPLIDLRSKYPFNESPWRAILLCWCCYSFSNILEHSRIWKHRLRMLHRMLHIRQRMHGGFTITLAPADMSVSSGDAKASDKLCDFWRDCTRCINLKLMGKYKSNSFVIILQSQCWYDGSRAIVRHIRYSECHFRRRFC